MTGRAVNVPAARQYCRVVHGESPAVSTVWRWCVTGRLRAERDGKSWLISLDSIDEMYAERKSAERRAQAEAE